MVGPASLWGRVTWARGIFWRRVARAALVSCIVLLAACVSPFGLATPAAIVPRPSPTAVEYLELVGTGGYGIHMQLFPRYSNLERVAYVAEGALLEDMGKTVEGEGASWRLVRNPRGGKVGYIQSQFLRRLSE